MMARNRRNGRNRTVALAGLATAAAMPARVLNRF